MSVAPKLRMTVDEFLAWSQTVPGRHELVNGEVFAMSPERARHARAKAAAFNALAQAIRRSGTLCEAFPDGMTVRIDQQTIYEPDAAVHCGERLDDEAVEVANPVVVVEVLSPRTGEYDTTEKLVGYFRVDSVQHYLIVDPVRRLVIHHRRAAQAIETRIATDGALQLDPPGLTLNLDDVFRDL
jgi:Uma2 family endonuclease